MRVSQSDRRSQPNSAIRGVLLIGLALLFFGCQALESDSPVASESQSTLAYGFNHAKAGRSFRAAGMIDSTCAMCAWGKALVLGPNINAPMDPDDNATARHYPAGPPTLPPSGGDE